MLENASPLIEIIINIEAVKGASKGIHDLTCYNYINFYDGVLPPVKSEKINIRADVRKD